MRVVRDVRDSGVTVVDLAHGRLCQVIDDYARGELFEVTELAQMEKAEEVRQALQARSAKEAREAIALLQSCCRQSKSRKNRVRYELMLLEIGRALLAPGTGLLTHDPTRTRPVGKPATRDWRRKSLPNIFAHVRLSGYSAEDALVLIARHYVHVWSAHDRDLPARAFRQLWGAKIQPSTPLDERTDKVYEQLRRQLSRRGTKTQTDESSLRP